MPDNFPGVFVEEIPTGGRAIEGVPTSTAGFVGPARFGPVGTTPELITSLAAFERVYGSGKQLEFAGLDQSSNYLWQATRAFFEEGGKRLYVGRIFRPSSVIGPPNGSPTYQRPPAQISESDSNTNGDFYLDGHARSWLGPESAKYVLIRSRFPGGAGGLAVKIGVKLGENLLAGETRSLIANGLTNFDTVWISGGAAPGAKPQDNFFRAIYSEEEQTWVFAQRAEPNNEDWRLNTPQSSDFRSLSRQPAHHESQLRRVTLSVSIVTDGGGTFTRDWIALDPEHSSSHGPDSLIQYFGPSLPNPVTARTLPVEILFSPQVVTGVDLLRVLFLGSDTGSLEKLDWLAEDSLTISRTLNLAGGHDGQLPGVAEYIGVKNEDEAFSSGLLSLQAADEISMVATPGATANYKDNSVVADSIIAALVDHAERMRYCVALVDSGDRQQVAEVRATRALIDSKSAVFFYPWIRIVDPITNAEVSQPPSGFVAGIYARNDDARGVWKAPANEEVRSAVGLEKYLTTNEQEILNPEGINCFRSFPGRGILLWGARTGSSDPEWKYVNIRRYFVYLEHSIDKGTQWAVFEVNAEPLWLKIRRAVEDFLTKEWRAGALMGVKPEEAFYVKCDRSTMTEADIQNGRLLCEIGLAAVRPAEFVILRIGQWTASKPDPDP